MALRLYNTLSRKVEPFEPLAPPRVTIYTCGPTVWNYAHIGNFRTFLTQDLLRRYLEYLGCEVVQIMNITDVDDRIIAEADRAGVPVTEHTAPYIAAFFADRDYLESRYLAVLVLAVREQAQMLCERSCRPRRLAVLRRDEPGACSRASDAEERCLAFLRLLDAVSESSPSRGELVARGGGGCGLFLRCLRRLVGGRADRFDLRRQ